VVSTRQELLEALGRAQSGQIIYVRDDAVIEMTGADDQAIPGGVTLASGRGCGESLGGLIHSTSLTDGLKCIPMLKTGGAGCALPGCACVDHLPRSATITLIKSRLRMLSAPTTPAGSGQLRALGLEQVGRLPGQGGRGGAHPSQLYPSHTALGFGYGVWVSGGGMAVIEANLLDFCRHHVASGAQADSSFEARYNICLDHDVWHSFDRHGDPAHAGNKTLIHHNEFRNPDLPAIVLRGNPVGEARFHDNWFAHANQAAAIPIRKGVTKNFSIGMNHFGPLPESSYPTARATATPTSGPAPLTVEFDASASSDGPGGPIASYLWSFNDTPDAVGPEAHQAKARYTFRDPGRYHVGLRVANAQGIPSRTLLVPVTINPPRGDCVLSAWIKDSYYGPLKGYYRKQSCSTEK